MNVSVLAYKARSSLQPWPFLKSLGWRLESDSIKYIDDIEVIEGFASVYKLLELCDQAESFAL